MGAQNDSPIKTGYERDLDYKPESERLSPEEMKEEVVNPKKKQKIGKRNVHVVTRIDFTLGQTRMDVRNQVKDQMICHIVQKVLRDEMPYNHEGVFYKCAKNWHGVVQKDLVISSSGHFLCIVLVKGHT